MNFDHEQLLDYLEGELSAEQTAQVEAALGEDPKLARLIESLRSDRDALRSLRDESAPPLAEDVLAGAERQMLLGDDLDDAQGGRSAVGKAMAGPTASGSGKGSHHGRLTLGRVVSYAGVAAVLALACVVVAGMLSDAPLLETARRWNQDKTSAGSEGQSREGEALAKATGGKSAASEAAADQVRQRSKTEAAHAEPPPSKASRASKAVAASKARATTGKAPTASAEAPETSTAPPNNQTFSQRAAQNEPKPTDALASADEARGAKTRRRKADQGPGPAPAKAKADMPGHESFASEAQDASGASLAALAQRQREHRANPPGSAEAPSQNQFNNSPNTANGQTLPQPARLHAPGLMGTRSRATGEGEGEGDSRNDELHSANAKADSASDSLDSLQTQPLAQLRIVSADVQATRRQLAKWVTHNRVQVLTTNRGQQPPLAPAQGPPGFTDGKDSQIHSQTTPSNPRAGEAEDAEASSQARQPRREPLDRYRFPDRTQNRQAPSDNPSPTRSAKPNRSADGAKKSRSAPSSDQAPARYALILNDTQVPQLLEHLNSRGHAHQQARLEPAASAEGQRQLARQVKRAQQQVPAADRSQARASTGRITSAPTHEGEADADRSPAAAGVRNAQQSAARRLSDGGRTRAQSDEHSRQQVADSRAQTKRAEVADQAEPAVPEKSYETSVSASNQEPAADWPGSWYDIGPMLDQYRQLQATDPTTLANHGRVVLPLSITRAPAHPSAP